MVCRHDRLDQNRPGHGRNQRRHLGAIVGWWNRGLPHLVFSREALIRARIEALEQLNRGTPAPGGRPDPRGVPPLGMLWPEMDAALVMSGGGNGGPSAATRRRVVSGLQTSRNKGILATCRRHLGDVG